MVPSRIAKEGKDMKRALIVTMIAGAFALSTTLPLPTFSEEAVPVPAPDAVADTTACTLGDGTMVAVAADVASGRAASAAAVAAARGAATVRPAHARAGATPPRQRRSRRTPS
jgi:hypothetical protein